MPRPNLLDLILRLDHDITRHFQLDYMLFDAVFLALYVTLLIRRKRVAPLYAGLVCAPILYAIDGLVWTATGVRECTLPAPWGKHPVDFMMDASYAIVAFSWVWIAFERRSAGGVALWPTGHSSRLDRGLRKGDLDFGGQGEMCPQRGDRVRLREGTL